MDYYILFVDDARTHVWVFYTEIYLISIAHAHNNTKLTKYYYNTQRKIIVNENNHSKFYDYTTEKDLLRFVVSTIYVTHCIKIFFK